MKLVIFSLVRRHYSPARTEKETICQSCGGGMDGCLGCQLFEYGDGAGNNDDGAKKGGAGGRKGKRAKKEHRYRGVRQRPWGKWAAYDKKELEFRAPRAKLNFLFPDHRPLHRDQHQHHQQQQHEGEPAAVAAAGGSQAESGGWEEGFDGEDVFQLAVEGGG